MARSETEATKLLSNDHRAVEQLFEKFEKAGGADAKQKIVAQLCEELIIHTMIEEEIFYPSLRGEVEDELLDEAVVEHDSAKMLIVELMDGDPDEEWFDAKVKVLKEQIEHHVDEEERRSEGMFAQARKSDADLEEIGEQMAARKEELREEADAGRLPTPQPTAMTGSA